MWFTGDSNPGNRHRRLLRARRERPRCRRAADKRDEVASVHSTTSSAATSRPGGAVSPSAFAVLRFTADLKLGRRLHRKVARLVAAQDAVDIKCRLPTRVDKVDSVGHETTRQDEKTK